MASTETGFRPFLSYLHAGLGAVLALLPALIIGLCVLAWSADIVKASPADAGAAGEGSRPVCSGLLLGSDADGFFAGGTRKVALWITERRSGD